LSAPPIRLGPFEVLEPIGSGASGRVWLSVLERRDREDQLVAIKVLGGRNTGAQRLRDVFRREVQAVAELDHPNIVNIYDLGTVSQAAEDSSDGELRAGSPYLAMELLDGGTLRKAAREMRWRGIRRSLLTVLDALAHSHARGVLHRDIKAGNILLGRRGMTLVDFGIGGKFIADPEDPRLGLVEGTPPYMAPEQLEARWRDYGPWTDLYSLGCLSYTLIAGKPPFGRDPDFTEMMFSHLHHHPPPLDSPYPVPEELQNWLYQLLAKSPADRFQRAADATLALLSMESVEDSQEGPDPPYRQVFDGDQTVANPLPISEELFPEVSSDRRLAIRTGLRATLSPGQAHLRAAAVAPPLPDEWRQASDHHQPTQLQSVGIGLFGLRSIAMVGRDEIRDQLWANLGRVRAQGRARVLVLRGGAGTGKSRLARWACERAHELGAAHILRAFHSEDSGPLDGMGPMVRRHFRCSGLDHPQALERIRSLLTSQEDLPAGEAEALAELVTSNSADPDAEGTVLFDRPETWYVVLERLLERLGEDRPVIMWLDDVQWGLDALGFSQQLLDHQRTRPSPVLVIMTLRDEALLGRDVESLWLDDLLQHPRSECVEVNELDPHDRLTLVRELLGLEGDVAGEVAERTAGNPLFAVQLVGDWVQRGILVPGKGGYRLQEGAQIALPDDIHQVWTARIDEFLLNRAEGDRQALELAAALGLAVSAHEWRAACAKLESRPSRDLVSAMVSQRLARWEGMEGDWAFANAMLRESLERAATDQGRWRTINGEIAGMLRETGARVQSERLARHLLRAGRDEDALEPLLLAIHLRFRKGEYVLAGRLLSEFDGTMDRLGLGKTEQRRGTSLLIKARIARKTADYEGALELCLQTEAVAQRHGWQGLVARARLERANCQQDRFESDQARELYASALKLFRELDEPPGEARALMNLGLSHSYSGNFDEARSALEAARVLFARLEDQHGVGSAAEILAGVELSTGRHDACQRHAEAALEIARDVASVALEARTLLLLGDLHRIRDDPAEAEQLYRKALRAFRGAGSGITQITELHVAWALVEQERFEEVKPMLQTCREKLSGEGRPHFVAMADLALMVCAADQGDWAQCDSHLTTARQLLDETGFIDVTMPRLAQMAAARMAAAGMGTRARSLYTEALAWWQRLGQEDRIVEVQELLKSLD